MLDYTRPTAYADLSANLTRLYANAALRTFVAAASQGLLLWSGFINASMPRLPADQAPAVSPFLLTAGTGHIADWTRYALPMPWLVPAARTDHAAPAVTEERQRIEDRTSFSAYRSDSGHAVAQVILG